MENRSKVIIAILSGLLVIVGIVAVYFGISLSGMDVIVNNLEKKDLDSTLKNVVEEISDNMDVIKTEIMKNKSLLLDSIIESSIVYV